MMLNIEHVYTGYVSNKVEHFIGIIHCFMLGYSILRHFTHNLKTIISWRRIKQITHCI